VIVGRSAGTASVFGYNYVDDGYINTNTSWIEVGLNASHMVGSHHVLFEGNYGFNFDSDKTHGNAIYHTVFRNHLRGYARASATPPAATGPSAAPGDLLLVLAQLHRQRARRAGPDGGWVYESGDLDTPSLYKFGWDDWAPYPIDPKVAQTAVRHGNYDYLNNAVRWDPGLPRAHAAQLAVPEPEARVLLRGQGLHLALGGPHRTTTQLSSCPAKVRYDAGSPFVQP
jgi:hypothetical protein